MPRTTTPIHAEACFRFNRPHTVKSKNLFAAVMTQQDPTSKYKDDKRNQLFLATLEHSKIPDENWKSFIPFIGNSWKEITPEALYSSARTYYFAHILPDKQSTMGTSTSKAIEGSVYYTQGSTSKNTNTGNYNNSNHGQSNRGRSGYRGRGRGYLAIAATTATTILTEIQRQLQRQIQNKRRTNIPNTNPIPHNSVTITVSPATPPKHVKLNSDTRITCNTCKRNRQANTNRNKILPHLKIVSIVFKSLKHRRITVIPGSTIPAVPTT